MSLFIFPKLKPFNYFIRELKKGEENSKFEVTREYNKLFKESKGDGFHCDVYIIPESPKYYETYEDALKYVEEEVDKDIERNQNTNVVKNVWRII